MPLLKPDMIIKSVLDITPGFLKEKNISALLLDVDNTLAYFGTKDCPDGIEPWIDSMRQAGIELMILSNAKRERIRNFANRLGLPFYALSMKPLPFRISLAAKRFSCPKRAVALVGDQIFTDILGGNLTGLTTILVTPFTLEPSAAFRFKRKLESKIVKREE